jgi:hypothetical protein
MSGLGTFCAFFSAVAGTYSPFFSKLSNVTLPLYNLFADGNAGEADGLTEALALADSDSAVATGGCTVRAHADNTAARPTPPAPNTARRLKATGLEEELVISSLSKRSTDEGE